MGPPARPEKSSRSDMKRGSELTDTRCSVTGLCDLIGVPTLDGSNSDYAKDERSLSANNGACANSFGRINCYRRGPFVFDAMQGSDDDCRATEAGEAEQGLFVQSADNHAKWVNNR